MSKPQQQPPQKKRVTPAPVAPQPRMPQRQATPQQTGNVIKRDRTPSIFANQQMIYSRQNYIIFLAGLGLITLGLVLMLGGSMPSPDVWNPEEIYSDRRITLAPMCMLAGFGVVLYGIFYQAKGATVSTPVSEAAEQVNKEEA
jgi:Protein of unknown function (DUF3098)